MPPCIPPIHPSGIHGPKVRILLLVRLELRKGWKTWYKVPGKEKGVKVKSFKNQDFQQ